MYLKKILSACTSVLVAAASIGFCCRPVPVYAEDSYTGSTEWQNWLDYWHSSLNVAIDDITGGAVDADDLLKVRALQYAYSSILYQQVSQALVTSDNYIPAGTVESGWYYRGGLPHTVTCFYYGQNNDPANAPGGSVVFASAPDFTISIDYTPTQNISYPAFYSVDSYGYYYVASQTDNYISTLTFNGTNCTGIMSNYDFTDSNVCYVSRIATYNYVKTYDENSVSSSLFVTSGSGSS